MEGQTPSNLTSVVGENFTSIHLTWTPPSPLGDTTGYRISYTTGGGVSDSVYVSGGSTDNYTLTGLGSGEVYNISIVGTSEHFFSESVAWETVNLTIPGELIKPVYKVEVLTIYCVLHV